MDVNEDKKQDVFVKGIVSKEYVEDFDLTLGCETKFSLLTEAVTRKCQGGKFTPSFDVKPAVCNPGLTFLSKNYVMTKSIKSRKFWIFLEKTHAFFYI